MRPNAISEKDARRLRALKVATWIAIPITAVLGTSAYSNPSPTWRVHAVAVVVFAVIPLLGRRAPLFAAVALLVCGYADFAILTTLVGTGAVLSMFYLALAGLAFALLGSERIQRAAI